MQESEFSTFVNHGDLVVKAKDFPAAASQLKLKVIQGSAEQVVPAREYAHGVFFCFQPLNHEPRLLLRFELSDNGLTVEARQKTLQVVWLKNDLAQTARLGDFAAEFGPTTVREPTVLLLEPVALQPELPLLGVAVRSEPVHFAFLDTVHYKFRVPAGTERPAQLGIFKYRPALKKMELRSHPARPGSGIPELPRPDRRDLRPAARHFSPGRLPAPAGFRSAWAD